MTFLAALTGLVTVGGIWVAATSWRPVPTTERTPAAGRRFDHVASRRLLAVTAGATLAVVITRWPIATVAGGGIGWLVSGVAGRTKRRELDVRTEAIALWVEMLRDAIGTARGVEGVLVATAATAPLPIRTEVQTMARRLQHRHSTRSSTTSPPTSIIRSVTSWSPH